MLARFQNIVRSQFKETANKVPETRSAQRVRIDCRLLFFCHICEREFVA